MTIRSIPSTRYTDEADEEELSLEEELSELELVELEDSELELVELEDSELEEELLEELLLL